MSDFLKKALFWLILILVSLGLAAIYFRWVYPIEMYTFEAYGRTWEVTAPHFAAFLLLTPLLAIGAFYTLSDLPKYQRGINLLLRFTILVALTGALLQIVITTFEGHVSLVFLVDTSASIPDDVLAKGIDKINETRAKASDKDNVKVIAFAEKPYLVDLPEKVEKLTSIPRPPKEEQLNSDPSAALRMAYGILGQNHLKRVILLTDGNETKGSLFKEVIRAKSFGIHVYGEDLKFTPTPEVFIQSLIFPDEVKIGEPFKIIAQVFSTHDITGAKLSLWENGFSSGSKTFDLKKGINEITFQTTVEEPGMREFEAKLTTPGGDTYPENNTFTYSLNVQGKPRILYVEGNIRSRHYFERALRNENFDIETRGPLGIPTSLKELTPFDLVVISDVPAQYMSRNQMALLDAYTRELGGGLIVVGGENSFGPGGYYNTPFEKTLPVNFQPEKKRNTPSLALLLVIDRSSSMEGERLELAKEAAKSSVQILDKHDKVGVIAFDNTPSTIVPVQSAANRARINSSISRLRANGGTNIAGALAYAFEQLVLTPARLKHIILLSDGNSSPLNLFTEVMPAMRFENITVSTVGIGNEADTTQLRRIASAGKGRYYYTNDPYNVPMIFSQETSKVSRSAMVEEPFRARVSKKAQILNGIDWNTSPYLLGYVSTKAKPSAEVLLKSEYGEPILARKRNGLGKVVAFTSDLKNRWAVNWLRWSGYSKFWAQLVRDTMRSDNQETLAMTSRMANGVAYVSVDAIGDNDKFINGLESIATVTPPDGKRFQVPLHQIAPGRYEGSFPLKTYGSYAIKAVHKENGVTEAVSLATLSYPYPEETLSTGPNTTFIHNAVDAGGGSMNPTPTELFDPGEEKLKLREQTWPYFLVAALILMLLDLFFRRIRLSGKTSLRWDEIV